MEQEKLYVIEEKTYEATSTRKFTSTGYCTSWPSLPGRSRTAGTWRT